MKSKEESLKNLKQKIAISKLLEEGKMKEKVNLKNIIKPVAAASVMIISLSGMAFAKDISKKIYKSEIYNKYHTGKGVETAINEGYIENTNMSSEKSVTTVENEETGEIIEDIDTDVKVSDLVMDDFSLSMTFDVTLSEKISNIISVDEIIEMNFPNIVLYDENNNILNGVNDEDLKKFSEEKNITPNERVNSGLNVFTSEKTGNTVKVVYNLYTGTGDSSFPKSKEIHISMDKIKVSRNETHMGDEEITINGNWDFKVDVPEKMYNRDNVSYIQKSTTNEDFNVISANLYNTGMEIVMKFKAEKLLSYKEIYSRTSPELTFYYSLDENDKLRDTNILNYLLTKVRSNPEYQDLMKNEMEKWHFDKYLTNSNGERFDFTVGPRENGSATIDENGYMTSTCMFDLTKYNSTDEITLHLDYKGNTAEIVLQKVNN